MRVRPLGDTVYVKRDGSKEKSTGGIFIPESAQDEQKTGTIVFVGTGEKVKEEVKIGDHIIFSEFAGCDREVAGQNYLILKLENILGVLEDE